MLHVGVQNGNSNVVNNFKNKINNAKKFTTYDEFINYLGECHETKYENNMILRSWIIRSESRVLYKATFQFDDKNNNLGLIFETNQTL